MNGREPSDAVYFAATAILAVIVLIVLYGFEGHRWITTQFCGAVFTGDCVARTEQITLFTTLTFGGSLIGVLLRHQMRQKARRDAERDKAINDEMDQIRRDKRG